MKRNILSVVVRCLATVVLAGALMGGNVGCKKCCKPCDDTQKCAAGCTKPCCADKAPAAK